MCRWEFLMLFPWEWWHYGTDGNLENGLSQLPSQVDVYCVQHCHQCNYYHHDDPTSSAPLASSGRGNNAQLTTFQTAVVSPQEDSEKVHLLSSLISLIQTRTRIPINRRLRNCSIGFNEGGRSQLHLPKNKQRAPAVRFGKLSYVYDAKISTIWTPNLAMLYHNSLLNHLLTFLQTDVNPFFLIGAVVQMDSRSSTSTCEVFAWR